MFVPKANTRTSLAILNFGERMWGLLKVQSVMRMWLAMEEATWRLAGIICIQSHIRKRLGVKSYQSTKKLVSKIQAAWRGYRDSMDFLHSLADILIVQSIIRRRLAIQESKCMVERRRIHAVTKIQSQWRSFWQYSHFVILRYQISLFQALTRGYMQRNYLDMLHFGATIIQGVMRRYVFF